MGVNPGEASRFFDDLAVGDELPPLEKRIDAARMMAYGAATWDFIRVHYDADYARELGFPGPFVDGQMMGAFLAQHVQDWAGPGAFLRKLAFRNRVMAYPGDSLVCRGTVTALYREGYDNPHSLSHDGNPHSLSHPDNPHSPSHDDSPQSLPHPEPAALHPELVEGASLSAVGFAECELWIENQRGEKVVDRASAVVQLPLRNGSG